MDDLQKIVKQYIEMFGNSYPMFELGTNIEMIKKCIDTKTPAEELYADKIKDDVEY